MVHRLYYYESPTLSPYSNLAREEVLAERIKPGEGILYLWRNAHTVVLGKHQNAYEECHLEALQRDAIHLARRKTGGGAVFHDEGNLNFTFLNCREDYDTGANFSILQNALSLCGIPTFLTGRNDLVLQDGRKFSGNAFFKGKTVAYHHGTLMLAVSMERLEKYLHVNPQKLQSKGVRSVSSRVVNLCHVSPGLKRGLLVENLKKSYQVHYGLPLEEGAPLDLSQLSEMESFYRAPQWIWGENLHFDSKIEKRFDWGLLTFLKDPSGRIRLYSDALDTPFIEYLQTQVEKAKLPLPVQNSFNPLEQQRIEAINEFLRASHWL